MKLVIEKEDRDKIVQYISQTALPVKEAIPIMGLLNSLEELKEDVKEGD